MMLEHKISLARYVRPVTNAFHPYEAVPRIFKQIEI